MKPHPQKKAYNQELQLASCGIICSQARKKAWKKYWNSTGQEIMLLLFSSQSYYKYKTTTRKPTACCKQKSTSTRSRSIFDPRAQCTTDKHYKLWCHHMELRTMAVSSGKTAFGQAVSYALSKVGKPEMVLKNELWRPYAYNFYIPAMEAYRFSSTRQEISVPNGLED